MPEFARRDLGTGKPGLAAALSREIQPRYLLLGLLVVVALLHGYGLLRWSRADKPAQPKPPVLMEISLLAAAPAAPSQAQAPTPAPAEPPPPPKAKPAKPKPKPKPKPNPPIQAKPEPKPLPTPTPAAVTPTPTPSAPVAPKREAAAPAPAQALPLTAASIGATYGETPDKHYPRIAQQRGWQGKVTIKVSVAADGSVSAVSLQQGSGHEVLDEAALEMVGKWRFNPARRGDQPVASSVVVPVIFRLTEE